MHDFDDSSILIAEKHQLERVRNSVLHHHNHLYWERDVERMNTALRLLDLILDRNGEINSHYLKVNLRNRKRFLHESYWDDKPDEPLGLKSLSDSWDEDIKEYVKSFFPLRYEAYTRKVWYLYNAFRQQWLPTWWD